VLSPCGIVGWHSHSLGYHGVLILILPTGLARVMSLTPKVSSPSKRLFPLCALGHNCCPVQSLQHRPFRFFPSRDTARLRLHKQKPSMVARVLPQI